MSQKLNRNDWPYISSIVHDSNLTPIVAAEGIACSGRKEAHYFVIKSILQMSHGCTIEDIYVVFQDRFFEQYIVSPDLIDLSNNIFLGLIPFDARNMVITS